MHLRIVATVIGIFLLSCVALPNPIPETDEGATYKEPTQNPDLNSAIDNKEQEILAIQDWLENTPEGQELSREADKNPSILKYYPRWIAKGETHEQALESWSGAPRRIARDIQDIPKELENVIYNPTESFEQHYEQRLKDAGITGHARAVGLVGFDIVWGTFNALAQRN